MPTSATTKRLIEVPAKVWTALRLKPGTPVHWEVRGEEAVVRAAGNPPLGVDDVVGMLGKHVKRQGKRPPTASQMRAAAKKAAAARFLRSTKDVA